MPDILDRIKAIIGGGDDPGADPGPDPAPDPKPDPAPVADPKPDPAPDPRDARIAELEAEQAKQAQAMTLLAQRPAGQNADPTPTPPKTEIKRGDVKLLAARIAEETAETLAEGQGNAAAGDIRYINPNKWSMG